MVLEHALLPVLPGQEADVEAAFAERALIAAGPGLRRLSLSRCLERRGTHLALVEEARLEDQTEGFRGSAAHRRGPELLHSSDEPFPVVEHVSEVLTATPTRA